MWGPGLADSDAVTFFAVPPVSWLPEDKTTRNFLELILILSLCYIYSRESKISFRSSFILWVKFHFRNKKILVSKSNLKKISLGSRFIFGIKKSLISKSNDFVV